MSLFLEDDKPDLSKTNTLWVEKYRPQVLSDYVGSETLKNSLSSYIKNNDIPNILLHSSSPGTGKTTAAKMIGKSIDCDLLYINASDERKVDELTTRIKGFVSCVGFKKWKVVVLDEVDRVSGHSQSMLRNLLEMYSHSTRFILTCNHPERLIAPVVSRCQVFEVIPPSKRDIAVHLSNILKKENIEYDKDNMAFIVNTYYPDIRKVINTAQQSSISGKLIVDQKNIIDSDVKLKVVDILINSTSARESFNTIRQLISDNKTSDYTEWFTCLYNNVDKFSKNKSADCILTIAEHQYQSSLVPDKEISFSACMVGILRIIHKE